MMVDMPPAPPLSPVTTTCILNASKVFQVPLYVLLGVMAQEQGRVGQNSQNTNGTKDHGPMQINTVKLSELNFKKHGIPESAITNNGCLNIFIGAAILKEHANKTGNWWKAIGHYHSKTPEKRDKYLSMVAIKIQQIMGGKITLTSILRRANGND